MTHLLNGVMAPQGINDEAFTFSRTYCTCTVHITRTLYYREGFSNSCSKFKRVAHSHVCMQNSKHNAHEGDINNNKKKIKKNP